MNFFLSSRWSVRLALIIIALLALIALTSQWWLPYDPQAIDLPSRLLSPDAQHWLGTDHLGRDIFSRLMAATRVSLGSVMACLLLVLTLGLVIGGSAGLIGGRVDQATMRVADMFMTFPTSILSFFMVGVLGTGLTNVIIAIALSHWAWYARMVRSLVISLRQREFVLASRLSGAGHVRVFVDHLAGAVIPSLLVLATLDIDLLYGNEGLLPLDTFARFSQNPAYHTQLSQPIETVMLALNTAKAPTNELAVREALNYAVNKKSLIDNALYGTQQVADTLFAPSVPYANLGLKPSQYDPQKAKALLEKAGWTLPAGKDIREKNGQPLRIELSFIGTDALSKSMAEIIQADMRQIGADVSLIGEEESSIYARQRDGRFGMIFHRTWGAPYDPHAFLSSMRVPSHADFQAQQGLADKPLIDKEIGEVLATHDETQRQALYRDILTRLHDEAVYLPISYISMMVVSKPELGNIPYAPIATEIPFEQIKPVKP